MAKKKTNKLKIYSLIFVFFAILVLFLTIGYSSYSTSLAIDGKGLVRPIKESRISDVKLKQTNDSVIKSMNYTAYGFVNNIVLNNKDSFVTYDITVTNLSSENLVITKVNNQVYSNSNIEYVFDNIEINKTKIKPASQSTFQITFRYKDKNNIKDNSLNCILTFTFRKLPVYKFSINSIDDTTIVLEESGNIYEGTKNIEKEFDENSLIKWTVSKDGYYTLSGEERLLDDVSKEVNLIRKKNYLFSITPNPDDSVVTIYKNNNVLKTGIGFQEIEIEDESEITYSVTKNGYEDINEKYIIHDNENISVTLNEIINTTE